MPTIKISYEDIRQEAKELLKELKKTNPKTKLTQAQTLIANKYDCKNLAVLRNKAENNNKVLEIELTDKIVSNSTKLIKQLFIIEPFNDNKIPCATVYVKGRKDTSGKTVRLDEKTIENLLDDKNTILTFHDHFRYVIGDYYLELLCLLLSNKNNTMFDIDKYIHIESLAEIAKKYGRREEDVYLLDFTRTSTKDLENIDDESRKVIESNMGTSFFLNIEENDKHLEYKKIINEAIDYAYEIGDKDECTDKHIAYVLSSLYLGGSPLQAIDYSSPNPSLEFDSKKIIKLYKLWDKVEKIVPRISKSLFKEIVSKNDYAFYFDDFTINKTRDLIDMDFSSPDSNKVDNDKRILDTLSNIVKKHGTAKSVNVNMSDLIPEKRISEDEIFKSLDELEEKGIIKSVNKDDKYINITLNPKLNKQ